MSVPAVLGLVAAIVFAGLATLTVIGLVWGEPTDPEPTTAAAAPATSSAPAPSTSSAAAAPSRAPLSAKQVADRLAELYPLPNPRDNTHSCRAAGCRQLITTDAVSVYEWNDEALAKRWAAGVPGARRVGAIVLSWAGSEQALTSQGARAKMVAAVRALE